ncbi:MAG: DUF6129 family protein [Candidatus Thiodiazotropha endolucinida]|nr:DUF6129 family protein [Candidatus Thiodiazotropha endolucinida]
MITQQQLDQIAQVVGTQQDSSIVVGLLRSEFPDLHFTYCMDDDVVETEPAFEDKFFNLYLIDKSNHCISFTQDMQTATGVVLAEIEEDSE